MWSIRWCGENTNYPHNSHVKAWLCCSNMLPLRGEQQATDYNPAKAYIR